MEIINAFCELSFPKQIMVIIIHILAVIICVIYARWITKLLSKKVTTSFTQEQTHSICSTKGKYKNNRMKKPTHSFVIRKQFLSYIIDTIKKLRFDNSRNNK